MGERRTGWKEAAQTFLDYFQERGHTVVPSSPLVPANDPTLLFTNAGMVQFKDTFLGLEARPYRRAATLQKCMRVQGKHNDLETVGPSPWHHTFFLMLGNFSFGDYFKGEAIGYAYDLMTRSYGIAPERLVTTVLETDDEAHAAWQALGVPASRLFRMGEKTNFWMMADIGPCGPTSELHYDWGPESCTCGRPDCSVALDNGCLRWLEVWNLVFMQFDQHPDGTRVPLPRPGVDTGMGLERLITILQGVPDVYRTDLFEPLLDRLQEILGHDDRRRDADEIAYRVMADHGRAMTFLLADGVVPGNEGRGYVLRMIMRRAMRFARAAGAEHPFLGAVAGAVVEAMGGIYPELHTQRAFIQTAARGEEERFAATLSAGIGRLEELIAQTRASGGSVLPGEEVFRLYDTYGFPVEMTRDVARERGLGVDEAGFVSAMAAQRERARTAQTFAAPVEDRRFSALIDEGITPDFVGYDKDAVRAKVLALFAGGERVERAGEGEEVELILDRTPFYPEGGGQVGDTGTIVRGRTLVEIRDTKRAAGGLILHLGVVRQGSVRVSESVRAAIDAARRLDIMRNHTATHLLHKALRETLGEHARQAGSLVAPDRLRFDFIHLAPLTAEKREAIEAGVNDQILADLPVRASWLDFQDAVGQGAMALFGEKYGDRVRMISINGYSRELCGGTHLSRTGQVGLFKITQEGGVASGVRRIEALTGRGALAHVAREETALRAAAEHLRTTPEDVPERVRRLAGRVRELEKTLETERARPLTRQELNILDRAVQLPSGESIVSQRVHVDETPALRTFADRLKHEMNENQLRGAAVLVSDSSGVIVVSSNSDIHAGKFAQALTGAFGGSGGGNERLGQGGLKDIAHVDDLERKLRNADFLWKILTKKTTPT